MRRLMCVVLLAALAGCGGDDDGDRPQGGQGGDRAGAEAAVRDYLRALVAKDGSAACSHLTPDYQRSVVQQNEEFARKQGAGNCAELIDAITRESGSVTFEGQPLNADTVGKLKLEVSVREGGQASNATVTGARGLQRYELITSDDKWLIAEITRAGG
jgi:hypothetical protein